MSKTTKRTNNLPPPPPQPSTTEMNPTMDDQTELNVAPDAAEPVTVTLHEVNDDAPAVEDQGVVSEPQIDVKESVPEVEDRPVAQAAPVTEPTEVAMSDFERGIAALYERGTPAQRSLIAQLRNYIDRMKPGMPVSGDKGAGHQYSLWVLLSTLVNQSQDDFTNLWALVLAFFHEYRDGVFHDRYVFRFSEYWSRPEAELQAFQRLLNLIKLTSNVAGRESALKQIDLQRSLSVGFTEAGRQRLLQFYNV